MVTRKKRTSKKPGIPEMLITDLEWLTPTELRKYPDNPRVGDKVELAKVLRANGYAKVLIVQKSTNYVLDGNQTHQCAKELGIEKFPCALIDVDDKTAAKMVIAFNRLPDRGGYDHERLAIVADIAGSAVGTGYSDDEFSMLQDAIEHYDMDMINEVTRPDVQLVEYEGGEEDNRVTAQPKPPKPPKSRDLSDEDIEKIIDLDESEGFVETVDGDMGAFQLREDYAFFGGNYWEIPDLDPDRLLQTLPEDVSTWGGQAVTPDDGVTTWVWQYAVSERKGLPGDRAILCFFTHDYRFLPFWDEPAFYTAKMMNLGITRVVVPDFSFYDNQPTAKHIHNTFMAQWMGRYFQECGLEVIPRVQFALHDEGRSLDFCMAGTPVNPPILAQSIQNLQHRDDKKQSINHTRHCLRKLQPSVWMVYGGKAAQDHITQIKPVERGMCNEVVYLQNYAGLRRGKVYDKKEDFGKKQMRQERKLRDRDPSAEEADFDDLDVEEHSDDDAES